MAAIGIARAHQMARRLLHGFGVRAPEHINLEAIAHACGADIVIGKLDGSSARVFRVGAKARIRVSDRIVTLGARRFSIAHELGHLVLGHEIPTEADVERFLTRACARGRGASDLEREANAFAAELLMPKRFVKSRCAVSPVNLCPAHAIATEFATSIVASARRLAELSPERCAAAYSEGGSVKWISPSRTFGYEIARGARLAPESIAFGHFENRGFQASPQPLAAQAWLPTANSDSKIVEHAEVIPEWGGVLSMLWIPPRPSRAIRDLH